MGNGLGREASTAVLSPGSGDNVRSGRTCQCAVLASLASWQVEDGNDLLMAIDTVDEVHRFWTRLGQFAMQSGEEPFELYTRLVSF